MVIIFKKNHTVVTEACVKNKDNQNLLYNSDQCVTITRKATKENKKINNSHIRFSFAGKKIVMSDSNL